MENTKYFIIALVVNQNIELIKNVFFLIKYSALFLFPIVFLMALKSGTYNILNGYYQMADTEAK